MTGIPAHPAAAPTGRPSSGGEGKIGRRGAILGSFFGAMSVSSVIPEPEFEAARSWAFFKRQFVAPDGRVVDTGNRGISHSEGQGYGMLIAAHAEDRAGFELIADWTHRHLQRRDDALHCWRYDPNSEMPVADTNNATDGDIVIAWALQRAAAQWRVPAWRQRAIAIAQDVLRRCVLEVGDRLVLLPGASGFLDRQGVMLNLSYYVFPALAELSMLVPGPQWKRLVADGRALIHESRFGRWGLPADWISLPRSGIGRVTLAPTRPPRFSYDAVRVPLFLAWGGWRDDAVLTAAASFWMDPEHERFPAWTDLRSNVISPYPADAGIRAVAFLSAVVASGSQREPRLPLPWQAQKYYDTALCYLAHLAWAEARLQRVA